MNAELLKSVVGVCYVGIFLERGFPGMWMLDGNCRSDCCGWDSFVGKCHNLMSNFFEKRIVILIDMNAPVSSSATGVPAR